MATVAKRLMQLLGWRQRDAEHRDCRWFVPAMRILNVVNKGMRSRELRSVPPQTQTGVFVCCEQIAAQLAEAQQQGESERRLLPLDGVAGSYCKAALELVDPQGDMLVLLDERLGFASVLSTEDIDHIGQLFADRFDHHVHWCVGADPEPRR